MREHRDNTGLYFIIAEYQKKITASSGNRSRTLLADEYKPLCEVSQIKRGIDQEITIGDSE